MSTPVEALNARVDVVGCLERARERLQRDGWVRARPAEFTRRKDDIAQSEGWTLMEALVPPEGADDAAGQFSAWHARFVILKAVGAMDLVAWAAHPYRTRREVLDGIRKAIAIAGGRAAHHRGGWAVSSGPRSAA